MCGNAVVVTRIWRVAVLAESGDLSIEAVATVRCDLSAFARRITELVADEGQMSW
jgi:hypothetical protein